MSSGLASAVARTTMSLKLILRYVFVAAGGIVGFPLAIVPWLERKLSTSEIAFNVCAQIAALFPGQPGNFIRAAYYLLALESFHPTAVVSFGSYFSKRGTHVAAHAGIGAYCVVGLADIGARVRIASRVSLVSGLNYHGRAADIGNPVKPPVVVTRLSIGERTWIGEGAIVGANVGRGCMIAVGSVVTSEIPDFSVVMGNPARLVPGAAGVAGK